jgi:hypothetical protein
MAMIRYQDIGVTGVFERVGVWVFVGVFVFVGALGTVGVSDKAASVDENAHVADAVGEREDVRVQVEIAPRVFSKSECDPRLIGTGVLP